tara:strand:- start:1384 stop:2151 length:768 start_codon:yes stop_codon:yes gene_type:complete
LLSLGSLSLPVSAEETPSFRNPVHPHHPSYPLPHHQLSSEEDPLFRLSGTGAWDSRYVAEGRDSLAGDSLFSYTLEASYENLTLGFWHAESPDVDFTELNLWLEYGIELADFELYATYQHLWFVTDDADDNEVGFGFSYQGLPFGVVPAVDWYYSFAAEGGFTLLSLSHEFEVGDRLTIVPQSFVGFNGGYVPDGHHGADHAGLLLEAILPLANHWEMSAYLSYNWAIHSEPFRYEEDADLADFFYGGAAITWSF